MTVNWRRIGTLLLGAFDGHDIVVAGGLAVMTAGVARLSSAWAMIVCGSLVFLLGIVGILRKGR